MLRTILSSLILVFALQLHAQTYFYISDIDVQPNNPTTADNVSIELTGSLSGTGSYVSAASATVTNNVVNIDITAVDDGGATVIVPHTETIALGMLDAGQYTIVINGTNVDDLAAQGQHFFEVTAGGSACDSLDIISIQWHPFTDTAIVVHVSNQNTNVIFDYPNFILFDANGDTLAIEVTNFFGIAGDSWHVLPLVQGAVVPESPFLGTLELWTGFTTELVCSWTPLFDLCLADPCVTVYPTIQNFGGAITMGDFEWSITDGSGVMVENGVFSLPNVNELDSDTICLPPGSYQMVCEPIGGAGGGQPYFTMVVAWPLTSGSLPAIGGQQLDVELLVQCSAGINGIGDQGHVELPLVNVANGMIEVRNRTSDRLGPITLHNLTGRAVATEYANGSYCILNARSLANGIYVLRVANTTQKILLIGN